MKYLLLTVLMSIMAFCSKPSNTSSINKPIKIVDTNWKLVEFQATNSQLQKALNDKATLWFTGSNSIGGHTGCNSMGGDYQMEGDELTIQAFSTKMYCEDVATMENAINSIMAQPMTTSISDNLLTLENKAGKLVYRKMGDQAAAVDPAGGEAAPEQYDQLPTTAQRQPTTAAVPAVVSTDVSSTEKTITEMNGLFRYMADAAVFQRCVDGARYAVSLQGDFKTAESYYNRMEKYGAPALMQLEVEVTKNPGEGWDEMLIIRKVIASSYEENCPN